MTKTRNDRAFQGRTHAAWAVLVIAIALEVSASLAMSAAQDDARWFVLVAFGYVGAIALLPQVLRRGIPLGVAYGVWGAAGVALTAVLSALLFRDPITPLMVVGIAFIIAGVLTIDLGSIRASAQLGPRGDR